MSKATELVERIEGIDIQSVNPDDKAESFFQSQQQSLTQALDDDDVVGLGSVFYTALGSKLSGIGLDDEFKTSVETHLTELATDSGGYYEISDEMLNSVNKWNETENEPTALGTAYSILLAYLLDIPYPNTPSKTVEWSNGLAGDNGLFINEDWSDTKLKYRYPSEYLGEAFLTHVAAGILSNKEGTDSLNTGNIVIFIQDECLFSTEQLAAEYYAIRLLEIADHTDEIDIEDLSALLDRHKTEVDVGYSDYLLSDKRDEQSGSKSRTGRDTVYPQICATCQALIISNRYNLKASQETTNEFSILLDHDDLVREDGGYGFPIKIREYKSVYGPATTPRSTYYSLLGKEVF